MAWSGSSKGMGFDGDMNLKLKRFYEKSPGMFIEASEYTAVHFITNMVEGRYGTKPPILDGILRGSFTVFVNNMLVSYDSDYDESGQVYTSDIPSAGPVTVWVSSLPYTNKMENTVWTPGIRSAEDSDVGPHFFATGLKGGAEDYGKFLALKFKKLMNAQGAGVPSTKVPTPDL